MFGDAVLWWSSPQMWRSCSAARIRSRGSAAMNFLIFMPNVRKEEGGEQRAEEILFGSEDLLHENIEIYDLFVAVSAWPLPGAAYELPGFIEHADRALYRAKAAGKQQAVCYQDEMLNGLVGRTGGGSGSLPDGD